MRTVCGLDVHKDSIFACILCENGDQIEKKYDVLTPSLLSLRDDLRAAGVNLVALESTSIYWVPILRILGPCFEMLLANPLFIKQMPGRKNDQADAAWIAQLALDGYIRKSYIPNEVVQQMRLYHRRYTDLRKQLVRLTAKTDNILQRCNIRISNYISNTNSSKSYQKVLDCLLSGETSAEKLADCIHGRIRNKHGRQTIVAALTGEIFQPDLFLLSQLHKERSFYEQQQQECLDQMQELADCYYSEEVEILQSLPGMGEINPLCLLAEIGADMSGFETGSKLVGWAGLRPRNDESAGKVKSRKIMKGNKYLRTTIVQIAWSAIRTKDTWFYRKHQAFLARHMSSQKATIAIARKMLLIIWNMLSKKQKYDPNKQILRACCWRNS